MHTQPSRRRPRGTLYGYFAREMVFPTFFALAGLTLVVLTKDLLGFSDLVINRGLGAGMVAWIAFYQSVPLATQTLPFAVLVGSLMAIGRLGADHELLVLEASGISSPRLVWPVVAFAAAMTCVGLALSLVAAPWASRSLDAAFEEVSRANPAATVVAGRINRFGDWKLEAREVSSRGDEMKGVLLWMPDVGETVFARAGTMRAAQEGGSDIELRDGMVVVDPRTDPKLLRFGSMSGHLPDSDEPILRKDTDRLTGMPLFELAALSRSVDDPKEARRAEIALHRRFALPLATLLFGALVIPISMIRRDASRASGGVMGILCTLAYYGIVQLGDGLSQAGLLSVVQGVWLPNALLAALAVAAFWRLVQRAELQRDSDRPTTRLTRAERRAAAAAKRAQERGAQGEKAPHEVRTHRFALQRYVAWRFIELAALAFAIILVAYLLVDVLERLQFFARYEASASEVLRYFSWRLPLLASRVFPMALLVATALTVSLLAVQGELMGMRSTGIPAPRALLPILLLCAGVTPLYFLLNNEVLPSTNALTHHVKHVEIKGGQQRRDAGGTWYRRGNRVYEAAELDSRMGTATAMTVYELGADGMPTRRIDARWARHVGGGIWRLHGGRQTDVGPEGIAAVESPPFADLGEAVQAEVDTRHLSIGELREEIREVEEHGYDATAYRVDLFVKIASPFACLILPALALFFAVSGPPHPSSAMTLVMSVVTAASHVLLTGVFTSLGYGGAIPPWLAGFAPQLLFGGLAIWLLIRLRGFGQSFF